MAKSTPINLQVFIDRRAKLSDTAGVLLVERKLLNASNPSWF